MVRFLHTADWQLGMTRHFLDGESQPRFTAARIDAIRSIGALAVRRGCGFVVVAGDVFETNQVDRQVVVRALDAMAGYPDVTFYLLPGNHDPLNAGSVFTSPTFTEHRPSNVVVLSGSEPVAVRPGLELIGAPWTSKRPLEDLVSSAIAPLTADGTLRVVVGHGALDVLSPDDANPALVSLAAVEAAVGIGAVHYVALGDRHSTTSVGASGAVWYSGAPEPTDFREVDPGNVLVVEVADDGSVTVESCRVGSWTFLTHQANLAGEVDIDQLDSFLDQVPDKARTIVRLSLVGQLSVSEKARLDQVLGHHADLFASLQGLERRIDLVVLPDTADLDSIELSGYAAEAVTELQTQAQGSGSAALAAQDALALLFRLSAVSS